MYRTRPAALACAASARATLAALASLCALPAAHAQISLIAQGSISGFASEQYGLTGTLENGTAANLLGGLGPGLGRRQQLPRTA